METSPPNVSFRRDLVGSRLVDWYALLDRLDMIQLSQGSDEFRWTLHENGKFLVDSMYRALVHSDVPADSNKQIWKMKMPLKTKKFAWYLRKGVILTKDNIEKRNWKGSPQCCFCHHDETITHLFFQCKFARSIWSVIQVASNLYLPRSAANIFGNWLCGLDHKFRILIRVGAIAILWLL